MSELINALNALKVANNRIDQLEKYNLDLANESHNKSARITEQEEQFKLLREDFAIYAAEMDLERDLIEKFNAYNGKTEHFDEDYK